MLDLLADPRALIGHVMKRLHENAVGTRVFPKGASHERSTSCVLFPIGRYPQRHGGTEEACIVFNKRSPRVRQPGDLCFPGGRVMPRFDRRLSFLLRLPLSPLRKWPYRRSWLFTRGDEAEQLAVLLTAGLREGLEEMRLNPLGLTFLGPMSGLRLTMFGREVYPMVVWIDRQKRFFPNWEVEKILRIPLRAFLDEGGYACYRLRAGSASTRFPCFLHVDRGRTEILWGLTYDMVVALLGMAFSFAPPELDLLPVVQGALSEEYLKGAVLQNGT
jgi:hypothetical protein